MKFRANLVQPLNLNSSNADIAKQIHQIQEQARTELINGMPIRPLDWSSSGGRIGNQRAYEAWTKIFS